LLDDEHSQLMREIVLDIENMEQNKQLVRQYSEGFRGSLERLRTQRKNYLFPGAQHVYKRESRQDSTPNFNKSNASTEFAEYA